MDKLITMTDFVLKQSKNKFMSTGLISNSDILEKILNYANFLKQPLKLGMFVPCDDDGNVLKIPNLSNYSIDEEGSELYNIALKKYKKAKEKVLFDGFEYIKDFRTVRGEYIPTLKKEDFEIDIEWGSFYVCGLKRVEIIEDLTPYNLILTKNIVNNKHEL